MDPGRSGEEGIMKNIIRVAVRQEKNLSHNRQPDVVISWIMNLLYVFRYSGLKELSIATAVNCCRFSHEANIFAGKKALPLHKNKKHQIK